MDFCTVLSNEFNVRKDYSQNIINLIDEGNTIPFIARYRKEMTGTIDDQVLRAFADRLTYLRNLETRKNEIIKSITEQGKMTDELNSQIASSVTQTELEDIYRPYKQKKKTRAGIAISKGLQPLCDFLLEQKYSKEEVENKAKEFVNENVKDIEEAISGASDIIAEKVSDDPSLRTILKDLINKKGQISCELVENEGYKTYETYKDFKENVSTIPSYRILAINRGENENCLKVKLVLNEDLAINIICNHYLASKLVKNDDNSINFANYSQNLVYNAIIDGYERLLFPSLERETRSTLTDSADEQAIKTFETNLKPLLLQQPLKGKTVMGLDPAYRTGCKIAIVDQNSTVLDTCVIYPTPPQSKIEEGIAKLKELIEKYNVDVISIGNGTASKESEIFVSELIKQCKRKVSYIVVSEAGASVYSASKLGAEEFPDFDVAQRSAVSIARRLQDPLAELIKIDVKSIGVGQYQHDMPQNRLSEVLGWVVEDCVNSVGVDLNTASYSLLSYVSGLNMGVAKNIVKYRDENGAFETRKDLLKVPKLGEKAFEQSAGFLRIIGGKNILDNTGVHPESYDATKKLLKHFNFTSKDVENHNVNALPDLIAKEGSDKVAESIGIGEPTLNDIVQELLKPGRDIRDSLPSPILRSDLMSINDLKPDMVIVGTVRNVVDFGAFVDIGVHQDGLVHISQICNDYIKHPSEVLKVGDKVKVKVLGVDLDKQRISLTMKNIDE
jgi:protein Tex